MSAARILAFACLSLLTHGARAEGACPPGQIPHSNAAVPICGPIPTAPYIENITGSGLSSRWGAIASDGAGIYGIAENQTSKSQAKKQALGDCAQRGGRKCSLHFTYKNQCAVIVTGARESFSQSAATHEKAGVMALMRCEDANGQACALYYSGCSLPVADR